MKQCPRCNRLFDDTQSFCLEDGTSLVAKAPAQSEPTVIIPASRRSRLPFILIGLLIVVVFLIGGSIFLMSTLGGDSPKNRQVAVNIQSPTPSPTATKIETPTPAASPEPSFEVNSNTSPDSESDSNATVTYPPDDAVPERPLPIIMRAEDHLVLFALHQCRKSGSSIVCDMSLTNKGDDRQFELITYRSRLYDELGNGYRGSDARVAREQGGSPRIDFIKGVTTRAQITFNQIEPNTTKITLLDLTFNIGRDNNLSIKFRNVPLVVAK